MGNYSLVGLENFVEQGLVFHSVTVTIVTAGVAILRHMLQLVNAEKKTLFD